jgi:hypothetical protein
VAQIQDAGGAKMRYHWITLGVDQMKAWVSRLSPAFMSAVLTVPKNPKGASSTPMKFFLEVDRDPKQDTMTP